MKIQAENADQYLRHCKNLAIICGKPEDEGQAIYTIFARAEDTAHRLQEYECNVGELTPSMKRKEDKIRSIIEEMLKPEFKAQFFINGDPRGYTLKLKVQGKAEKIAAELPEGFYKDWGGYGILAPEF